MNRVRSIDADNATLTVDAGVPLARVQDAAAQAGLMFPLSLAAEGSCTIGGNLSTNAGGTAVLRYGNARDLTLGIEAVLADGRVWDGLRGLRKDNTGYDLKQLFIGAEGTLGIIHRGGAEALSGRAVAGNGACRGRRCRRGSPAAPRPRTGRRRASRRLRVDVADRSPCRASIIPGSPTPCPATRGTC